MQVICRITTVAIIYAVISIIVNAISVFSVKELSEDQLVDNAVQSDSKQEKITFLETLKLLAKNKYFLMIAGFYVLLYIQTGIGGVGIYYMTYVLGDVSLFGTFSMATMFPMVVGLAVTPFLVKKMNGMYRVNLYGYGIATVFRLLFVFAGLMRNIPFMLVTLLLAGLFTSPVTGDINALISATSEYTVRTTGKHIEGSMFSCSSFGMKIGGGIGSALSGILLSLGGYVANAAEQSASCINMLNFMYLWFPFITVAVGTVLMYFLKVEKANIDWDKAHKA